MATGAEHDQERGAGAERPTDPAQPSTGRNQGKLETSNSFIHWWLIAGSSGGEDQQACLAENRL